MGKDKVTSYLEKYLIELFKQVNRKFSWDKVQDPTWYHESTWSLKAQNVFEEWLIEEMKKDFEYNDAYAQHMAKWFILDYGWKIKED